MSSARGKSDPTKNYRKLYQRFGKREYMLGVAIYDPQGKIGGGHARAYTYDDCDSLLPYRSFWQRIRTRAPSFGWEINRFIS